MKKRDFEERFSDEDYVAVWSRWNAARAAWGKARMQLDFAQGGPDPMYDPRPELIKDETIRATAKEFIESRVALHAMTKLYT